MAAVIGRGIERLADGRSTPSDEVYDPDNRNNRIGLQSPFVLYYTVTISMNAVAILGGIASELDLHRNSYYYFDRCDAWLFANAVFGVLHIGAALYLVQKIREPARQSPSAIGNDGVYATGYRLHDSRDYQNRQDVEANANQYGASIAVATMATGPPDSLKRIRHVLCESKVFAAYIFVYVAYFFWHFFLDMYACNLGMAFAMRCADIFIWAAPCSFIFSVASLMNQRGELQ